MSPTNRDRPGLAGLIQRISALRSAQGNSAQILQPATPSPTPVSPKVANTVVLGGVLGLLLAVGASSLPRQPTGASAIPSYLGADRRATARGDPEWRLLA